MRPPRKARLRLRSLLRRGNVERELEDELHFHLDQLIEENIASGMASDEARWTALRNRSTGMRPNRARGGGPGMPPRVCSSRAAAASS